MRQTSSRYTREQVYLSENAGCWYKFSNCKIYFLSWKTKGNIWLGKKANAFIDRKSSGVISVEDAVGLNYWVNFSASFERQQNLNLIWPSFRLQFGIPIRGFEGRRNIAHFSVIPLRFS